MGQYDAKAASAAAKIAAKGGWVTLTVPGVQTVDTSTDTATQAPDQVYRVKALINDPPVPYGATYEQGTTIRQHNRQLYVAGLGLPFRDIPMPSYFEFAGHRWDVKGSRPLSPDAVTNILHIVDVGR